MNLYYEKDKVDEEPGILIHFREILKDSSPSYHYGSPYREQPMLGSSSNLITISMAPSTVPNSIENAAEYDIQRERERKRKKKAKRDKKRYE